MSGWRVTKPRQKWTTVDRHGSLHSNDWFVDIRRTKRQAEIVARTRDRTMPERAPWRAVPVGLYETRSGEKLV